MAVPASSSGAPSASKLNDTGPEELTLSNTLIAFTRFESSPVPPKYLSYLESNAAWFRNLDEPFKAAPPGTSAQPSPPYSPNEASLAELLAVHPSYVRTAFAVSTTDTSATPSSSLTEEQALAVAQVIFQDTLSVLRIFESLLRWSGGYGEASGATESTEDSPYLPPHPSQEAVASLVRKIAPSPSAFALDLISRLSRLAAAPLPAPVQTSRAQYTAWVQARVLQEHALVDILFACICYTPRFEPKLTAALLRLASDTQWMHTQRITGFFSEESHAEAEKIAMTLALTAMASFKCDSLITTPRLVNYPPIQDQPSAADLTEVDTALAALSHTPTTLLAPVLLAWAQVLAHVTRDVAELKARDSDPSHAKHATALLNLTGEFSTLLAPEGESKAKMARYQVYVDFVLSEWQLGEGEEEEYGAQAAIPTTTRPPPLFDALRTLFLGIAAPGPDAEPAERAVAAAAIPLLQATLGLLPRLMDISFLPEDSYNAYIRALTLVYSAGNAAEFWTGGSGPRPEELADAYRLARGQFPANLAPFVALNRALLEGAGAGAGTGAGTTDAATRTFCATQCFESLRALPTLAVVLEDGLDSAGLGPAAGGSGGRTYTNPTSLPLSPSLNLPSGTPGTLVSAEDSAPTVAFTLTWSAWPLFRDVIDQFVQGGSFYLYNRGTCHGRHTAWYGSGSAAAPPAIVGDVLKMVQAVLVHSPRSAAALSAEMFGGGDCEFALVDATVDVIATCFAHVARSHWHATNARAVLMDPAQFAGSSLAAAVAHLDLAATATLLLATLADVFPAATWSRLRSNGASLLFHAPPAGKSALLGTFAAERSPAAGFRALERELGVYPASGALLALLRALAVQHAAAPLASASHVALREHVLAQGLAWVRDVVWGPHLTWPYHTCGPCYEHLLDVIDGRGYARLFASTQHSLTEAVLQVFDLVLGDDTLGQAYQPGHVSLAGATDESMSNAVVSATPGRAPGWSQTPGQSGSRTPFKTPSRTAPRTSTKTPVPATSDTGPVSSGKASPDGATPTPLSPLISLLLEMFINNTQLSRHAGILTAISSGSASIILLERSFRFAQARIVSRVCQLALSVLSHLIDLRLLLEQSSGGAAPVYFIEQLLLSGNELTQFQGLFTPSPRDAVTKALPSRNRTKVSNTLLRGLLDFIFDRPTQALAFAALKIFRLLCIEMGGLNASEASSSLLISVLGGEPGAKVFVALVLSELGRRGGVEGGESQKGEPVEAEASSNDGSSTTAASLPTGNDTILDVDDGLSTTSSDLVFLLGQMRFSISTFDRIPYGDACDILLWDCVSTILEKKHALAYLFITGRMFSFNLKDDEGGNSGVLTTALSLLKTWETLHPLLLLSVLRCLSIIWVYVADFQGLRQIEDIEASQTFWDTLCAILFNSELNVDSSHMLTAKAYAMEIIGLDVRRREETAPQSLVSLLSALAKAENLRYVFEQALHSDSAPKYYEAVTEIFSRHVPGVDIELFRSNRTLAQPSSQIFASIYSVEMFCRRIVGRSITGEDEVETGGALDLPEFAELSSAMQLRLMLLFELAALNDNFAIVEAQKTFTVSWRLLLDQVLVRGSDGSKTSDVGHKAGDGKPASTSGKPASSSGKPLEPSPSLSLAALWEMAGLVAATAATELRSGQLILHLHYERLSLLARLAATLRARSTPATLLQHKDACIALLGHVADLYSNETLSVVDSVRYTTSPAFHGLLFAVASDVASLVNELGLFLSEKLARFAAPARGAPGALGGTPQRALRAAAADPAAADDDTLFLLQNNTAIEAGLLVLLRGSLSLLTDSLLLARGSIDGGEGGTTTGTDALAAEFLPPTSDLAGSINVIATTAASYFLRAQTRTWLAVCQELNLFGLAFTVFLDLKDTYTHATEVVDRTPAFSELVISLCIALVTPGSDTRATRTSSVAELMAGAGLMSIVTHNAVSNWLSVRRSAISPTLASGARRPVYELFTLMVSLVDKLLRTTLVDNPRFVGEDIAVFFSVYQPQIESMSLSGALGRGRGAAVTLVELDQHLQLVTFVAHLAEVGPVPPAVVEILLTYYAQVVNVLQHPQTMRRHLAPASYEESVLFEDDNVVSYLQMNMVEIACKISEALIVLTGAFDVLGGRSSGLAWVEASPTQRENGLISIGSLCDLTSLCFDIVSENNNNSNTFADKKVPGYLTLRNFNALEYRKRGIALYESSLVLAATQLGAHVAQARESATGHTPSLDRILDLASDLSQTHIEKATRANALDKSLTSCLKAFVGDLSKNAYI